jgi:hypothetical protein
MQEMGKIGKGGKNTRQSKKEYQEINEQLGKKAINEYEVFVTLFGVHYSHQTDVNHRIRWKEKIHLYSLSKKVCKCLNFLFDYFCRPGSVLVASEFKFFFLCGSVVAFNSRIVSWT